MPLRVGVDLMGSDSSPQVLFEGVVQATKALPQSCRIVVFALSDVIDMLKTTAISMSKKIEFIECSEEITMEEPPLRAVHRKRDSSLAVGVKFLQSQRIDALVSAGNTGALIANAAVMLQKLPGIRRPALLTELPSQRGSVAILDIGGNVSVKVEHIVQFARLGAVYQKCRHGVKCPSVGLLNIGAESVKGTSAVREAYQVLHDACVEGVVFRGNVEGCEVFQGKVDVLVTDGFAGNIFLKTAEGVSAFLLDRFQQAFQEHPSSLVQEVLSGLEHYINYDQYPGAIVCGVEGVIVKCHGYSSSLAMLNGIRGAIDFVQQGIIDKMKREFI